MHTTTLAPCLADA